MEESADGAASYRVSDRPVLLVEAAPSADLDLDHARKCVARMGPQARQPRT